MRVVVNFSGIDVDDILQLRKKKLCFVVVVVVVVVVFTFICICVRSGLAIEICGRQ